MAPAALSWTSDVDGDLGTGSLLTVATLSPGQHHLTARATDSTGHTGAISVTVTILDHPGVDSTPPTIITPSDLTNTVSGPGGTVVTYTVQVTDNLDPSPSLSCTPASGSALPAGTTTVTCTASDASGNTSTAIPIVVRYTFTGFFSPVDNPPVVNTVRAGSAVPVKFSVGGDLGQAILAAGSPTSRPVACLDSSPLDAVEQTLTAGSSSLQYDPTTGRYTYVWKTDKSWAGNCRLFVLSLADSTPHVGIFRFTK